MPKPASTVRFSQLVQRAGAPAVHLVLGKPEADAALQKARKENRVMTLYQPTVGSKTDHGTIGFEPGKLRQFLVFPKSLQAFAGRKVVGVKYDLLAEEDEGEAPRANKRKPKPEPKKKPAPRRRPARKPKPKPKPKPESKPKEAERAAPETDRKVIAFPRKAPAADEEPEPLEADDDVDALRRQVRKALEALEAGKQVVAYRLLEEIAGET